MLTSKKKKESSLTSRLLSPSSCEPEESKHPSDATCHHRRKGSHSNNNNNNNNTDIYHAYANNQPKIMLETINARTITIVFIVTYMIGFLSFGFDLQNTIAGFKDGNRELSPDSCSSQNIDPYNPPGGDSYGCTFQDSAARGTQNVWMGHATGFNNIISFSLKLDTKNITGFFINDTMITDDEIVQDAFVSYNVKVYCCYMNSGCGSVLVNGSKSDASDWRLVIDTNGDIDFSTYEVGWDYFETNILENTFQNQETLPDQGIIRSYHMYVTYDPGDTLNQDAYFVGESIYVFKNTDVQAHEAARVMLNVLFVVSIVVVALYYRALKTTYGDVRKFALPEQRWQVFYMVAVIMFQNPFYCVIMWIEDPPVSVTYVTYVIDVISQASFLTVWLLFSDGLRRNFDYWMFYVPKVLMGIFIALTSCVIVTLQFPSINVYDHRSPVLAVEEWSYDLKITLVSFSLIFLVVFCVWTCWWFYSLFHTGRQLQLLPYMSTRYLQLWFRFFFFQSILSSLYLIAQYGAVIYFIFTSSTPSANSSLENVADNINTLFRQQTLAFGKVLFITVNSFVLAFFLLPAGYFDKSDFTSVTNLATTYVVNESEIGPIYRARKRAIHRLRVMNELFMDHPKAHVFCIDIAEELLELSWEAYNDVPGYPTISGYGLLEFDRVNYRLVNHAYDEQHDTVCYIVRHKVLPRVVICFRGTSSKQHWADNMNYSQRPIDFLELSIPDLDRVDGLGSESSEDIYAQLRENDGGQGVLMRNMSDVRPPAADEQQDSDSCVDFHKDSVYSSSSDDSHNSVESWLSDNAWGDSADGDQPPDNQLSRTMSGIYDKAEKTIQATTGMLHTAVKNAPILNNRYDTFVHTGFWDAYMTVRDFIHTTLRQELAQRPAHVMCTGHSLGGALATLACLDVSLHTIPRVNKHLCRLRERKLKADEASPSQRGCDALSPAKQKSIKCTVYTFGSPRIGNNGFASLLNSVIPDYFRVTVDGDVVTAVPKGGIFRNHYKHAGTEVVIDAIGAGSIIIDPSFIERRLRTHSKTSMSAHSLTSYRKGINGLKAAAEFMRSVETADEEGGGGKHARSDPAFLQRQVVIAKASAKAAQVSIAHMALLQAQQDKDLPERRESEPDEQSNAPAAAAAASQSSGGAKRSSAGHMLVPSSDADESGGPSSASRGANSLAVEQEKSLSISVQDKVASQGRDMDLLVHSMSARPTGVVAEFGTSFVKVLSDLTSMRKLREDREEEKAAAEETESTSMQISDTDETADL